MKIGCILVLYNPDDVLLKKVIDAISPQVDTVFISDNSPSSRSDLNTSNLVYKWLNGNKGIAAAQNEGLHWFSNNNFDFIFYLDQDSVVAPETVHSLITAYQKLNESGINVGAVGPRPVNRQDNKAYVGSVKKGLQIDEQTTEVSELISSASLIPLNKFKEAGGMDETLFIDGVDHEWCWRAHEKTNCRFFIIESVFLSHQLGEGDRRFLLKKIAIPTPFRTYYQFRNYFKLIRRKYVPTYWKMSNGFKYFIKLFYYPIFISPRKSYLKNMLTGIKDGIINN